MRHAVDHRKLRRNPGHRKALLRNLMNALVRSERIETTIAKAKELRRLADRLVTLGKRNDTHARRRAFGMLSDKENTEKLFSGIAPRFAGRNGGYTRILRTGFRAGDGSEMAIIEYLPAEEKKAGAKKPKRKKAGAPPEGKPPRGKAKPAAAKEETPKRAPARKKPAAKKEEEAKKPPTRKKSTKTAEETAPARPKRPRKPKGEGSPE